MAGKFAWRRRRTAGGERHGTPKAGRTSPPALLPAMVEEEAVAEVQAFERHKCTKLHREKLPPCRKSCTNSLGVCFLRSCSKRAPWRWHGPGGMRGPEAGLDEEGQGSETRRDWAAAERRWGTIALASLTNIAGAEPPSGPPGPGDLYQLPPPTPQFHWPRQEGNQGWKTSPCFPLSPCVLFLG